MNFRPAIFCMLPFNVASHLCFYFGVFAFFFRVLGGLAHHKSHVLVWRCRCASAKRSRLLPEVFDDCSSVRRGLALRDRAIIREVNETLFALNFLETGGVGCSEVCEKVEYSIRSTDLASPAFHL